MPLIVVTGFPSSGKTSAVTKLVKFFEGKEMDVCVVREDQLLGGLSKNVIFSDSKHEKEVRGRLKSEVVRLLTKDNVVICDGLNYIKGFRYELYCASKSVKTTQVTVQCDVSAEDATAWNRDRPEAGDDGAENTGRYEGNILRELVQRYEAPVSTNRWDAPLFLVLRDGVVMCEDIFDALFNKKPPAPNQSTQNAPLSSTSFVYELDQQTQAVVAAIMDAQKTAAGVGVDISVPGAAERVKLSRHYTLPELARTKRQFLVFAKQKSCHDVSKLSTMFVQYLNANLTQ